MNMRSSNRSKRNSNKNKYNSEILRKNMNASGKIVSMTVKSNGGLTVCDGVAIDDGEKEGMRRETTELRQENVGTRDQGASVYDPVASTTGMAAATSSMNPNISVSCHAEKNIRGPASVLDGNSKSSLTENLNVPNVWNTHSNVRASGLCHAIEKPSTNTLNSHVNGDQSEKAANEVEGSINVNSVETGRKSYVSAVNKNIAKLDNKLFYVPTEITNEGKEFVVFDKEMVKIGGAHWKLTVCGYFVGLPIMR